MSRLVIVLGASGRLGQALIPLLAEADVPTVAITRTRSPEQYFPKIWWLHANICDETQRASSQTLIRDRASRYKHVAILDMVLDRHSVSTMKKSIACSTSYLRNLGNAMSRDGHKVRYIVAATTAIIAPWPFQTPYGLAKRRQAAAYLSEHQPADVALLPSLSSRTQTSWTYENGARVLRGAVESCYESSSRLLVPTRQHSLELPPSPSGWRGATAQVSSLAWDADSPTAHRIASHARLAMVPARWRPLVDHHVAPEFLVRRFARRHQLATQRVLP